MNAYSSIAGSIMVDSWPMARVMAGASAVPVGHAVDLAFLFADAQRAHHDALIVETRRHLGACLTAVETGLRLSLQHDPRIASFLARTPDMLCWPTLRHQPTLLSPALLAHMQMRAGVTLMLRQAGETHFEQTDDELAPVILSPDDPEIGDAVTALALAEARWAAPGGEDRPMRADVPAEHAAELIWTATACLAAAAGRMDHGAGWAAFERSGWALLADHDESASPIAEADRLVRRMGDRAIGPDLLSAALGQRKFLLFAALTARHLRLSTDQVTEILIMGSYHHLAVICRALGGSDGDYRYLLLALQPVRPFLSDGALLREAERYHEVSEAQADEVLDMLRMPAPFRTRLDHLMKVTAA